MAHILWAYWAGASHVVITRGCAMNRNAVANLLHLREILVEVVHLAEQLASAGLQRLCSSGMWMASCQRPLTPPLTQ